MKVNELRIGNLIYDDEGIFSKVTGMKPLDNAISCENKNGCYVMIDCFTNGKEVSTGWLLNTDSVKPIPLTEELLLKCGFKKIPKNLYVDDIRDLRTAITYQNGIITWNEDTRMVWVGNIAVDNIKYLHHLQNLYFAITGEELEVKL